tara:strand:+ start:422 stop:829 length:408 start_codon:yes stop_codon:yes gene_type:complete
MIKEIFSKNILRSLVKWSLKQIIGGDLELPLDDIELTINETDEFVLASLTHKELTEFKIAKKIFLSEKIDVKEASALASASIFKLLNLYIIADLLPNSIEKRFKHLYSYTDKKWVKNPNYVQLDDNSTFIVNLIK